MNEVLSNDLIPRGAIHEGNGHPPVNQHTVPPSEFLEIVQTLTKIQDLKSLYSTIAGLVAGELAAKHMAVFLYREETKPLILEDGSGLGSPNGTSVGMDEDLFSRLITENQPFNSYDLLSSSPFEAYSEIACLRQMKTDVGIPLALSGKPIGLLSIGERGDGKPLEAADTEFLMRFGAQVSICISNCQLYEKGEGERKALSKTLHSLSLIHSIGKAITHISDLKSLLEYILNQAIEISNAEKGSIMLYDDDAGELGIRILTGLEDRTHQERINNSEIPCRRFKPGEGIAGQVFETGKPVFLNKAREVNAFLHAETSFVDSIACIPMSVYGEALGVINLTNKQDAFGFTDEDIELLQAVADQAAIAINKAQLWDLAFTDSLTGLYDRRYFKVKIQEELQRARRYNRPFSIIMADVDKFKNVNDTFGHSEGDRTLKAIGAVLESQIRKVDVIARYGGDEFIMLFPEKGKQAVRQLSERLKEQVSREKFVDGSTISLSFGIASYPEDGSAMDELIERADQAMYNAKQRGRNRIESFSNDILDPTPV